MWKNGRGDAVPFSGCTGNVERTGEYQQEDRCFTAVSACSLSVSQPGNVPVSGDHGSCAEAGVRMPELGPSGAVRDHGHTLHTQRTH